MAVPKTPRTRSAVAGAAIAAAFVTLAAAPATAAPDGAPADAIKISLPAPTGGHRIGTVALHLVDRSRSDSLRPSQPYRELMVSLWYPARKAADLPLAPQMPPLAAADVDTDTAADLGVKPGQVDWAATMTHARVGAPVAATAGGLPVVLYSPGLDGPRALGTVLVEELASRGYLVVTVDHTYQPDQVEFPGGRLEKGRLPQSPDEKEWAKLIKVLLDTRTADMEFVLDQLGRVDRGQNPDAEHRTLPSGLRGALDLSRVGMFGHSFGGATAAQLLHDDRRVDAGINMDGSLYGSVTDTGVTRPFLQMASNGSTRDGVHGWKSFWERSTGWKREARFTGTEHLSFCDLQAMVPPIAAELKDLPATEFIGTIDPKRSIAAQRAYVTAFFDLHLRGRRTHLFDAPSKEYPEVKLVP
ncbi:alpha/beta hydrolase family protein [Sphaerisporangium fuscum]|uniref:alpha/beta hydrolase family protein n=1 Tax=Sphaerisporangium fuscum TaxID=2835868 RepID=UPI001BDC644F|nr:lipase [Sphaerisporangium fuscum]